MTVLLVLYTAVLCHYDTVAAESNVISTVRFFAPNSTNDSILDFKQVWRTVV